MEQENILAEGRFGAPFIIRGAMIVWLVAFVSKPYMVGLVPAVSLRIVAWAAALWFTVRLALLAGCSMTVTSRSVRGRTSFGKEVDLLLEDICSVQPAPCAGLRLVTFKETVTFLFLENRDELCALLGERVGAFAD